MGLMMKTISLLFHLVLCGFLVLGCGISGDEDRGTAPTIRAVYFYKEASLVPTSNFTAGDNITVEVKLEDPDLDIVTLHLVIYALGDPDTVYEGPNVYELDPVQASENTISQEFDDPFPEGDYRVDFQVLDEKGNASRVFKKIFFVL